MMKVKGIVLTVAGWFAIVLALWVALAIISTWFLVPDDHRLTPADNLKIRVEYSAAFAACVAVFVLSGSWAFEKARQCRRKLSELSN
jgi:threonine/homoserine efflux transporter RhtA